MWVWTQNPGCQSIHLCYASLAESAATFPMWMFRVGWGIYDPLVTLQGLYAGVISVSVFGVWIGVLRVCKSLRRVLGITEASSRRFGPVQRCCKGFTKLVDNSGFHLNWNRKRSSGTVSATLLTLISSGSQSGSGYPQIWLQRQKFWLWPTISGDSGSASESWSWVELKVGPLGTPRYS